MMKRLLALAAFLLASTAAQAQYSFEYGGRTIHIDPDRGTVSIPGVYSNTGRKKHAHADHDSDRTHKPAPEQAKVDPQAPAAPAAPAETPAVAAAPSNPPLDTSTTTANVAPLDPIPAPAPLPQDATAPAPALATAPPSAPAPMQ